ncbi:MAG: hypothetical protein H6718_24685 [Polyangiaceae bacterium]|nr:hypothetical protein [Myxococcales bacterium]MCB9588630.1 hypothetical protein [Polyangiaceae bacterium]
MDRSRLNQVLDGLCASDDPRLRQGAAVVVDALLELPLEELVDLPRVGALVLVALGGETASLLVDEHVTPGWYRQLERFDESEQRVGSLMSDTSWAALEEQLSSLRIPQGKWAEDIIDPKLMRELLSPVVQSTLQSFAKRLPGVGIGTGIAAAGGSALSGLARGLKSRVGEGAKGISDVGKSVVGGLEGRMQKVVTDFSRTAQDEFRAAMIERLKSDDGQALLQRMRRHALRAIREVKVADMMRDVEDVRSMAAELAPDVLRHNARGEALSKAVLLEVSAFLDHEGARPLSELLEETGVSTETREAMIERGQRIAQHLLGHSAVRDFLAELAAAPSDE